MWRKLWNTYKFSLLRVSGFSAHQIFFLSLFYIDPFQEIRNGVSFAQMGLAIMLVSSAFGLGIVFLMRRSRGKLLLSAKMRYVFAVCVSLSSMIPAVSPGVGIVHWGLMGLSWSGLLFGWCVAYESIPLRMAAKEIVGALGIASLICFCVPFLPLIVQLLFFAVLPFLSAYASLCKPKFNSPFVREVLGDDMRILLTNRRRLVVGIFLIGVATGCSEAVDTLVFRTFEVNISVIVMFMLPVSFAALIVASFPQRGSVDVPALSLYRFALFIMVAGYVVALPFSRGGVPLASLVVSGYLLFGFVLLYLLIAMEKSNSDVSGGFVLPGFIGLFIGEFVGIVLCNLTHVFLGDFALSVLYSLAGLFTLGVIMFVLNDTFVSILVHRTAHFDAFDEACRNMATWAKLSNREQEVLAFVLKGRTSDRIGEALGIARSTVDSHLHRIYAKTSTSSRQEVIDLFERTKAGELEDTPLS